MSPGTPPNVLWRSDSGSSFTSFGHLSFSPSPSPKQFSSDVSSGLGSRSNSIPSLSGSSPSYIPSPIPPFPPSVYTNMKKQNSRPNNGDLTYKKLPPLLCAPNDCPRKKHASKQRSQHEPRYQKEIVSHKSHPQDNTTKPIRLNDDHIKPEPQNKTETIHQPDTHEGNKTTSIHQPHTHDSKITLTDVPFCEKTTPTYRDKGETFL